MFVGVGFHSAAHPNFGPIREADINAAINIGLRAVAAPNCHLILAKVRVKQEAGTFFAVCDNKRESAVFSKKTKIVAKDDWPENMHNRKQLSLFVDPAEMAEFGRFEVEGIDGQLVHLGAMKKMINDRRWEVCAEINEARLKNWQIEEDRIPI